MSPSFPSKQNRRAAGWILLSAAVILIDQLSKFVAASSLTLHDPQALFPHVNLTLVFNDGASFGLLSGAGGWQRWLFIVIAAAVSFYLYTWLKKLPPDDKWTAAGLTLIIGGAVGNLIDRLVHGYVIDFIDVYYQAYHWPVFNVADGAIVIGAAILILSALIERKEETQ